MPTARMSSVKQDICRLSERMHVKENFNWTWEYLQRAKPGQSPQIRLTNIAFLCSESWLKGQHDMSTKTKIHHDTIPMYWLEVCPMGRTPPAALEIRPGHLSNVLCIFLLSILSLHSWNSRANRALRPCTPWLPTSTKSVKTRELVVGPDGSCGFGTGVEHFTLVSDVG